MKEENKAAIIFGATNTTDAKPVYMTVEYAQKLELLLKSAKIRPHGEHCGCPFTDMPGVGLGCPNPTNTLVVKKQL